MSEGAVEKHWQTILNADEAGVRLEIVEGVPMWEAHPALRHQRAVKRIEASIRSAKERSGCSCVYYSDIYIRFPDGSLKRPDIAVFCHEPQEEDQAVTLIPEAVIEVITRGFEAKDLEVGQRFYLSHGVKDVVVLDPYDGQVTHFRRNEIRQLTSPTTLQLECGCTCEV